MSLLKNHQSVSHKIIPGCVLLFLSCHLSVISYAGTYDIEAAIMEKDYQKASSLATAFLKSSQQANERVRAEYYLGLSQLRLRHYSQARSAFQVVMAATDSKDLYDRAALGVIESLYTTGYYKDALKTAQNLLQKSPQSSFLSLIYLKLAHIHLKMTHWNLAREYLQKILVDFPQSSEAMVAQNLMEEKEYFTVQVGSFLDKQRAIALTEQLKANGQYAYIIESPSTQGKQYYRVRVGQMASLSDAQNLENKLAQSGYPTIIYP